MIRTPNPQKKWIRLPKLLLVPLAAGLLILLYLLYTGSYLPLYAGITGIVVPSYTNAQIPSVSLEKQYRVQLENIPSQSSAHHIDGIDKYVYYAPQLIQPPRFELPHVQQWAMAVLRPNRGTGRHRHSTATEIFFVLDGQATFIIEYGHDNLNFTDSSESSIEMTGKPNDTIFIPPNTFHTVRNDYSEDLRMVYASISIE